MSISNKYKIVYVGNLVKDRCISELLDVAISLPDVEFHIGGIGDLKSEVQKAANSYSNVYYYGQLPYSDVLSLENECDIILALYDPRIPNHKYAAPNKFYEALGIGKPIIMFHNTGVDEVIDRYQIGKTVDGNKDCIRAGLLEIISRNDRWLSWKAISQEVFKNDYCWEIMENRLLELYDGI